MDSLNGVQYLFEIFESLNMKNNALAGARIDEKSREPESFTQGEPDCLFSQRSKGNGFERQFDLSGNTRFKNFRLVFENEIDRGDSSGRVAQRA